MTFAAACAVTIAATRAYLVLTGYPQIGGTTYHFAHALWGGLLLTVAAVLAVALHNTWVPGAVALLGGAGAGLFVDEVGKFITQSNDYFFPLAATIVYLFLVLLSAATVALARYTRSTASAHLHAALELAAGVPDHELTPSRRERLHAHLDMVDELDPTPAEQRLAHGLRAGVERPRGDDAEPEKPTAVDRLAARLGPGTTRRIARGLLLLQAVAGLLVVVVVPVSLAADVPLFPDVISDVRLGDFGRVMGLASLVATAVAGGFAFVAVRRMKPGRVHVASATRNGVTAMLVLLVVANSLGAYTSQFEILVEAGLQILTLAAIGLWRKALAATRAGQAQARATSLQRPDS